MIPLFLPFYLFFFPQCGLFLFKFLLKKKKKKPGKPQSSGKGQEQTKALLLRQNTECLRAPPALPHGCLLAL